MKRLGKRRAAGLAVAALIGLAVVGWLAAGQIRSPARVAAETAPPKASPITVPVVQRTLSTKVIVRGTVRYGAPQAAVLATSRLKQAVGGSDIVTRPPRRKAKLGTGDLAMAVDGRPVFTLPGLVPMNRDLRRGDRGPDVRQLEKALQALGHDPGAVDGRFDAATQAAVSAFYLRRGFDPFGPTELQLDTLRTAEAAAATALDAQLQALNTIDQAKRTPTRAEVEQARVDAVTAQEALDTAELTVTTAQGRLNQVRGLAKIAPGAEGLTGANNKRDQAAADLEVVNKRAALEAAKDEARIAAMRVYDVPLEAPPSEREAAVVAARQAAEAVPRAQAELDGAIAAAEAVRAGGDDALRRAKVDTAQAKGDIVVAEAELRRARLAVQTARSQVKLQARRARLLARPTDTGAMRDIATAAAAEARRTRADVARLAREAGVQVPANEILFFPSLPLRVDTVKARRGSTLTGSVMSVTSSRLAVDSSLAVSDAKLVRAGDRVTIEDQDLGVKGRGSVSRVATTPGTNRVDPTRFYFSVTPASDIRSLVGVSVKLTIAVKSTRGAVLAVPASALSVGGDGNSRVQVRRGGRTRLVRVEPGLAADGLVEVRGRLTPGDLVIVGSR
jgi:peptidoglycan hydrolase-like protein with peptidoglycan-binding domain